jgi:hypothetical protein
MRLFLILLIFNLPGLVYSQGISYPENGNKQKYIKNHKIKQEIIYMIDKNDTTTKRVYIYDTLGQCIFWKIGNKSIGYNYYTKNILDSFILDYSGKPITIHCKYVNCNTLKSQNYFSEDTNYICLNLQGNAVYIIDESNYKQSYFYDNTGKLNKIITLDPVEKANFITTYEYLENNRIIEKHYDNENYLISEDFYLFTKDSMPCIDISTRFQNKKLVETNVLQYIFDVNHLIEKELYTNEFGNTKIGYSYSYSFY